MIQLFADVRGSAGNYKIEIACTACMLGPHPQFINIGVVQGFEVGEEGAWSVNISDTIYNKIADGEDVRLIISDTNTVSVLMPQIANDAGKKLFGTSLLLDQNGGRIEYGAGASGVPGDYRLEIVAIVPDVGGGGGGVEIVDLGALTFSEGTSGAQASGSITQEQYNTLSASGTSPIIKFTDGSTEVFCQRTGWIEGGGVTYYTYAANTNDAIPARITSYSVTVFASGSLYSITAFRVTFKPIPSGGLAGQVLKKKSNSEYDVEWGDISNGGGVEVIDLGTVTLTGTNEEFSGTVTITSEQFTKMKAETPPIVNFEWRGDTYSLSRFTLVPNVGGGRTLTLFSGTYAAREGGVAGIQGAVLSVSAGSTDSTITANISLSAISLPDEGGGVEIVDLGTPTFQDANGGQYLMANVTLTSEQAAKLKAEPAPIVKFTLSGANGDYQNGAYYLTKKYLMGVGDHIYNTCIQVQDNGGWAITLMMTGSRATITIYPYKIPQEVEANPSENAGVPLEKLKVGDSTYAIPQGVTVKAAAEWASENPVLAAGEIGYDTTNKITRIGDGVTAWDNLDTFVTKLKPTFANSDWATIAELSESGEASSTFSVGDEKTIELSTGEEVTLVILGFDHDDLSDGSGKAGMTIGTKNVPLTAYPMNDTGTNEGGWDESKMRTSTMAALLSQLPSDLQGVIKQVNKKATAGKLSTSITTSADKLWLPAVSEIYSATSIENSDKNDLPTHVDAFKAEGTRYEYYENLIGDNNGGTSYNTLLAKPKTDGTQGEWRLRSATINSPYSFYFISGSGGLSVANATSVVRVSFCFCV